MNGNAIINIMVLIYFAKISCNNNFHEEDDDNVKSARALGRPTYATSEWAGKWQIQGTTGGYVRYKYNTAMYNAFQ